ncbi:MAG TPA: hypothetical protein VJN88_06240 [Ktedonobacterales bacterium]|nr:hypothetical protein [Ktedonobacterales bacterium]
MRANDYTGDATFEDQYALVAKDVFREIAGDAIAEGKQPDEQARVYAELGKPDFVLAYLLVCDLPDAEKRAVLARAYQRRATYTEERAREFDHKFHRPFPLLFTEAANDKAAARKILAGLPLRPAAGKQLPTL